MPDHPLSIETGDMSFALLSGGSGAFIMMPSLQPGSDFRVSTDMLAEKRCPEVLEAHVSVRQEVSEVL
jgi:hypothetical protein